MIYRSLLLLLLRSTRSACTAAEEQTCVVGEDGTTCVNTDNAVQERLVKPANDKVEIDWGETQTVKGDRWQETMLNIEATKIYMASIRKNDKLRKVATECQSRNEQCAFWAVLGKIYIYIIYSWSKHLKESLPLLDPNSQHVLVVFAMIV
jgi:hypothetical protein